MRYLSDAHGVNINAATFQYFQPPDGPELVARVFLLEPSQVELKARAQGSSKRRPNLSYEELRALAVDADVGELYDYAVAALEAVLQKGTTRSSIAFSASFGGSKKVVISFLPGGSSAAEGLHYQLYKNRFAELTKLPGNEVESLMPERHEPWAYVANAPDYEGFEGFVKAREEIDRLTGCLAQSRDHS